MKKKLKLCFLLLFCFIIFSSTVQAVDQVYFGIMKYEKNTPQIVYRSTVRPFSATEKSIIFDAKRNYNEWIDGGEGGGPTQQTYFAEYLIFTKEQLATYTNDANSYYGYYEYASSPETGYLLTSESIADFQTWWNYVKANSVHKKVTVNDKYLFDFQTSGKKTTKANFSLNNLNGYLNNILNFGETAILPSYYVAPSGSSGGVLKGPNNVELKNKLVPYVEIRRMLYNENANRTNLLNILTNGGMTDTMYVCDILVNENATDGIIKYISEEKSKGKSDPVVYVSAISSTLAWYESRYMYMLTPENFLHAKSDEVGVANWSAKTLGYDGNGEYSGLNLWDNALKIDTEPENKTIVINHVYVDKQGNFINIDRQEAVSLNVNGQSIWATANSNNLLRDESSDYFEKYKVKSDLTQFYIKNLKELDAGRIWTAENGFELQPGKYDVEGYAIYKGNTTNIGSMSSDINTLVQEANRHAKYKDGLQNNGNLTLSDSENIAVVNVYYTAPTVDIEVRHYCINNFNIVGNGYGTLSNGEKYPYTSTLYGIEYYNNVSRYDTITFARKANLEGIYEYKGYDFNVKESTNEDGRYSAASITITQNTETMEDGRIIIIFKYRVKSNTTTTTPGSKITLSYKENPKIDIKGTLSIQSINGPSRTCVDTYSVPTNARDNTKDIYVGIKQIPNYILAGMNVEQLSHSGSKVKISVTIKFGPNSKTWDIEVPYYLSYYVVENLMMYKFDNATVYNTKIGQDTYGEKLFANTDNRRIIKPTQTSALKLWAIANSNITNNTTNIHNWKNYLITTFKTGYSSTVDPNNTTGLVSNPADNYENNYRYSGTDSGYRREYNLPGYYGKPEISLDHSSVNNSINSYITNNLPSVYQNIALDGSASLTITLLSQDMFNKINSDGNTELSVNDLNIKINNTDSAISTWMQKGEALVAAGNARDTALHNYKDECSDSGYGYTTCYSSIESDCTSKDNLNTWHCCSTPCIEWSPVVTNEDGSTSGGDCIDWGCSDDCYYKHSCGDTDTWGGSECSDCGTVSSLKSTYDSKQSAYNTAETNELNARNTVENYYESEEYALQHFDEAYYIQENLWDNYKSYTTEQIVKLLDLDIKFDYSSGGAKIANTELLTVQKHTVVLDTKPTQNVVLGGHGSSLSGNKLTLDLVSLDAWRQTLTEKQKSYYIDGIDTASWIGSNITSSYYSNNTYTIPLTMLNGKRMLAATSEYKVDNTIKVNSIGSAVLDNMYYNNTNTKYGTIYSNVEGYNSGVEASETITEYVYNINIANQYKYYGANKKNSDGTINSQLFNIYAPLVVNTDVNQDIDVIDQTTDDTYKNIDIIQANSNFTINLDSNYSGTSARKVYSTSLTDFTERYLNEASYYIKFMFDIDNVRYEDYTRTTRSFGTVRADTWIGPIYGDTLQATARINTNQGASITDTKFEYYVIAAAVNTKDSWTELVIDQIHTSLGDITDPDLLKNLTNNCGTEGGSKKISYYASTVGELVIVNRMYDFRVTDVKDVDWKNVFRQNESSVYVNTHSGIAYYAGLSKWNTENPTKYNEIIGRTEEEVGTSPTRVLPVGPYKNTNKSYISAPKIGYRFSFDLKVTGASNYATSTINKSVTVKPEFYYISKDGKTYYSEYDGSGTGIYLFYKNNKGQYVRVGSAQDTYQIQFVPNDGYRQLIQTSINHLSKNNVVLGNLRELTLKFNETTTYSENDSAITYYGEYKLPNSTIAVKVENGKYDINKPLSSGYVGVIFDIYANEANDTVLSYSQNSYFPASSTEAQINTSQWDYEGYLGISKPGEEYSTTLRLEKGTWEIDNEMYNKIKGTVMLYDLDNKASNDFN